MTAGLDGKAMAYDGENRPLSVTFAGAKTCYVYGADGVRLKKIEDYAPAQACAAPTGAQAVTAYVGGVEIRRFGQGTAEEILLYPLPAVRIARIQGATSVLTRASTLHRDALGSVRAVTNPSGSKAQRAVFRPYGEVKEWIYTPANPAETKGFIGERFDADAGLQYLNARYYDPRLGLFTQPDWWEVQREGVGTNRYSYSFNDPVNGRDPGGHIVVNKSTVKDKKERDRLYDAADRARKDLKYHKNSLEMAIEKIKKRERVKKAPQSTWRCGDWRRDFMVRTYQLPT